MTISKKTVFDRYTDFKGEDSLVVTKAGPNSNVLIVDGMNTFIRSWSVNPTMNDHGDHYGGTVGFLKSLSYSIRTLDATRCIIVFDGKGGSQRRKKIFPEYKDKREMKFRVNRFSKDTMTREEERELMKVQLVKVVEYLSDLPVQVMIYDNVEADDVIAYMATRVFTDEHENCTILSTDKDFIQLVNNRVKVFNPVKKVLYDRAKVYEEFGMIPENYLLYRTLDGDKSDNIPGIPGCGMKTVAKRFPMLVEDKESSLSDILYYAEKAEKPYKLYSTVLDHEEDLFRNYALMRLDDVNISGIKKMQIMNRARNEKVPRLSKQRFIVNITKDGLTDAWPNPYNWLYDGFTTLDLFAKKINEEGDK